MPAAHYQRSSDLASLRRGIFKATHDPDIAERVFGLAVASRSPGIATALPWAEHGPLFSAVPAPPRASHGAAAAVAHDLCVYLAFIGAGQAERACEVAGPANWRLVQSLGGWKALHDVAPHFRRRHLTRRLSVLLESPRTGRPTRAGAQLRAARVPEARLLLDRWQTTEPALRILDTCDLMARALSLGALAYLLGRLADACDGWDAARVRNTWYRLAAKCPVAVELSAGN